MEDANEIFRCEYTKGKYYAPYRGEGPAPSEKDKKEFRSFGTRYVVKGQPVLKNPGFLDRTRGNNCLITQNLGVVSCPATQKIRVTTFTSKSQTAEMIKRDNEDYDFFKVVVLWGIAATSAVLGFKYSESANFGKYSTGTGLAVSASVIISDRMRRYLISDGNAKQSGRGLCYYSIQNHELKGRMTQLNGRTSPIVFIPKAGLKKTETVIKTGWYGPERNKACK